MELRDYLGVLRRGWALILTFVVAGLAAGIAVTVATPRVYRASVQVFVATSAASTPSELQAGNTFTSDRVQSYTTIANSPAVTGQVIKKLGLAMTEADLGLKISADAPQNKVLINIHVSDHDPVQAARLANAVAAAFDSVVESTEQTDANGHQVVKLTVIHPATVPSVPTSPNKVVNLGLGLAVGLLVGLGLVFLRDALDSSVKGRQGFEELGVPVLSAVPFDKRTARSPVAFRADLHGARSEAYRQLRTNMQFVDVDNPPRVIAVTSAVAGEGKSTTAINLAMALAEAGEKVCLVGADLRRPSLADSLGLVSDVGLTTVLIGKASLDAVIQSAGRNLAVLTSGPVPPNPSELLTSVHVREVLQCLARHYRHTVIDAAPLLPVTDGAQIAALSDATILVARAGRTTRDQVMRSLEALAKINKKPVGVVLNMITRSQGTAGEYGYYYYSGYRPTLSPAAEGAPAPGSSGGARARTRPKGRPGISSVSHMQRSP